MKDYRLSEIKAICEKYFDNCEKCPFHDVFIYDCGVENAFCFYTFPIFWEIEENEDDERRNNQDI